MSTVRPLAATPAAGRPHVARSGVSVRSLPRGREAEVLAFLSARPLETVYMAGLVRDNGLDSPYNRGRFYACRDPRGELIGVALLGHVTQVEARSAAALRAFAVLARRHPAAHVIMGEREGVRDFWTHYATDGREPRLACRELLLEQSASSLLLAAAAVVEPEEAAAVAAGDPRLRAATPADLALVMPVQAEMAFAECGVNPLEADPEGFRARYERRIARGRVWVVVEEGRLLFKADVMADTPQAAYLEGVFVDATWRGQGCGRRCLWQLGRELLRRSRSVCLLVNEERQASAADFYYKVGYRLRGHFDTIYMHR